MAKFNEIQYEELCKLDPQYKLKPEEFKKSGFIKR